MPGQTPFTQTRRFKVVRRVVGGLNPLTTHLLDSRVGRGMRQRLLLLRYRGRRSGRLVTTPVGYVRDGDTVILVTSATYRWWPNFAGGRDAELRLPEGWRPARLEIIRPDDPRYADAVALVVGRRGPGLLRGFGLEVAEDGTVARGSAADGARILVGALLRGGPR